MSPSKRSPKESRSYNMSMIRGSGTEIERVLGKTMFSMGLRYRKQYPITGRPDFAFPGAKVAVFCDSSFWHGRNWPSAKEKIKTNRNFWWPKIERNMRRDEEVNRTLTETGWLVIRFWDDEILGDPLSCAIRIKEVVVWRRGIN